MDKLTGKPDADSDESIYEVEEILNHKKVSKGKCEYLVKWKVSLLALSVIWVNDSNLQLNSELSILATLQSKILITVWKF